MRCRLVLRTDPPARLRLHSLSALLDPPASNFPSAMAAATLLYRSDCRDGDGDSCRGDPGTLCPRRASLASIWKSSLLLLLLLLPPPTRPRGDPRALAKPKPSCANSAELRLTDPLTMVDTERVLDLGNRDLAFPLGSCLTPIMRATRSSAAPLSVSLSLPSSPSPSADSSAPCSCVPPVDCRPMVLRLLRAPLAGFAERLGVCCVLREPELAPFAPVGEPSPVPLALPDGLELVLLPSLCFPPSS
ncbi:hypothetical protein BX661DRAFT_183222 [Kickxella alabastrina]|uniref:uncharacterized protein n=1 Tax=Kickxella alabastrina TaxID=61397 RepID=UPI00221F5741|nr:uncharacterized protein BX661DRAFT_183222 [Kickxella alabastrina]KAI7826655.1 hypothetical protein BX661DRAFT_183222 [Kickxella alabastrina]